MQFEIWALLVKKRFGGVRRHFQTANKIIEFPLFMAKACAAAIPNRYFSSSVSLLMSIW